MSRETLILIATGTVALVGAAYFFREKEPEKFADVVDASIETVKAGWEIPANGLKYADTINGAAIQYGVPRLLLARLLYQESRFRDDIISGKVRSPAGAIGIAQFLPATAAELKVDPLDPYASIDAAAKYLRQLADKFGTWEYALAAYNWGQGNLRNKGFEAAPKETRDYVAQITGDAFGQ